MKNIKEIAQAVKDHLISLAIEDRLPLDMNELKVSDIEDIILAKTMNIITVVKPQSRKICTCISVKQMVDELTEQAQELLDFGNSKEKMEGYGMNRVLNLINKM